MQTNSLVDEALSHVKAKVGETTFSTSSLKDPHIKKAVQYLIAGGITTEADIETTVNEELEKFEGMRQKAPILYDTISKNLVEGEVFKLFEKAKVDIEGAPKFSKVIFNKLVLHIGAENPDMWPLRNFIERRTLHNPQKLFIDSDHPEENDKRFKSVNTAAATPKGEFIFNVQFMQQLLDWGHVKGLKPKSKKYKCNGGSIPDEYAYIEFLIMHEFLHYTAADFHYQNIIPDANPTIINWVGDFRSNYNLVKSGYEQLPIGLYNDHINYDRQTSYIEMYNLVKSEMEKLDDQEKKDAEDKLKEQGDDHEPGNEEGQEQAGESEGRTEDDINENDEKSTKKVKGNKEGGEEGEPGKQGDKDSDKPTERNGQPGTGEGFEHKVDWQKIAAPQHDWKQILRQLLASSSNSTEETYAKPSRRMVSGLDILATRGATAVKPGDLQTSLQNVKLMIICDTSGSMFTDLPDVLKFIHTLCSNPALKQSFIQLAFFSTTHAVYDVNFASKKGYLVNDDEDETAASKKRGPAKALDVILSEHKSGGTEITTKLDAFVKKQLAAGYNVMLFSDSDICASPNVQHVKSWIKSHVKQTFLCAPDITNYEIYVKTFGVNSRFTCIRRK